jgi:hypothetical protein
MSDFYNQRWVRHVWGRANWAVTIGGCTFYSVPQEAVSRTWKNHEDYHKHQWKHDWYVWFAIKYIYYNIRYGYWNNPYERAARDYATKEEYAVYMEE